MMTLDRRGEGRGPGIRPVDEGPERSPRCIERARARCWNGVLPATTVGGDVTPFLSLK